MSVATVEHLQSKSCRPCKRGTPVVPTQDAKRMLKDLNGWKLASAGKLLRREWTVKDFQAGMDLLGKVAEIAEEEDHHPDVHLTDYKHVTVELTTHSIGGLSENDFILAAKINGRVR